MTSAHGKRFGMLVALVLGAACNSPTLPLPPPSAPEEILISADASRADLAGGGAQPGALVLVFNDEPTVLAGAIVTADAQGRYRTSVPLDLSVSHVNQLELWQRVGTDDSSLITFLIRLGESRGPVTPDAGNDAQPQQPSPEGGEAGAADGTTP